ncbi:MAG: hypothetical protein L0I24_21245, partial [Pseudonocardia sp.]|nr:hypothetical protein [Pseudonocardia sp.]
MFRWSDRGAPDAAPDDRALAARNVATQAFLALDDEQRAAATAVDAAEELGSPRRLRESWAQIAVLGDQATEAYLAATTDTPPGRTTRAADERATAQIERAREAIRRFRSSHGRILDEAAHLVSGLPAATHEARVAVVDARSAVAGTGVRSRRAEERLADAERSAARLDSPGLRERRDAIARTLELAREARALALDAPRTAATVRTALSSVATRRAAAQTRTERIPPALSALRREFSEKCSRDLEGAQDRALACLDAADTAVAEAGTLAEAGDWDDAADRIAAARAELARAEERADAVTDWNVKTGEFITEAKMGTPPAVRLMALVQTAALQALESAQQRQASAEAALAAAHRVALAKLLPAQQAAIDAATQAALAAIAD